MEGFPTFVTGVMMSGYYIGMLIGSLVSPRLVGRVGHIRVFAALASTASISILLHGLYINAFSWTLMRIITGFCYAGLYVVTESWLNDRASNETRGELLSVYMVIIATRARRRAVSFECRRPADAGPFHPGLGGGLVRAHSDAADRAPGAGV